MVLVFLELGQHLKTQISNKDKFMKSLLLFPLKIAYTLHTYRNSIPEAQDTLHQVSEWQHSHLSNTYFSSLQLRSQSKQATKHFELQLPIRIMYQALVSTFGAPHCDLFEKVGSFYVHSCKNVHGLCSEIVVALARMSSSLSAPVDMAGGGRCYYQSSVHASTQPLAFADELCGSGRHY